MQDLNENSLSNRVTALFNDRALSFALPKGATFEDLVDRLSFLGGCDPVAVIVNLVAPGEQPVSEAMPT